MAELPEDADERRMFDAATRLYDGRPLRHIAATLAIWSKMGPPNGSYGKTLAIFVNEILKAEAALAAAADAMGEAETTKPAQDRSRAG